MPSNLMDTAPGGESTQYESIKTVDVPTEKQEGQLGDEAAASAEQSQDTGDSERGEKTAENIRYGQNISESGMGGKTTESKGVAQQGGYGRVEADEGEETPGQTRRDQGYGSMPNVGA